MSLKRFPSVSSMSSGGRKSDRARSVIRVPKDSFKRLTDSFINARLNQASSVSIESGQDKVSKTITTLISRLSKDRSSLLKLRNKGLTDTHCVALAQALQEVPVVAAVDLRDNTITDVGASAMIRAMEHQAKASMHDWQVGSKAVMCLADVQLEGNMISQILLARLAALCGEAENANVELAAAWVYVLCLESKDDGAKAAFLERLGQGRSSIRQQTGSPIKSARRLRKALGALFHRTIKSKELNKLLLPHGLVQIEKTVHSRKGTFIGKLDGDITGIDLPTFVDICRAHLTVPTSKKPPAKTILHPHIEAETGSDEVETLSRQPSEKTSVENEVEEVKTSTESLGELIEQSQTQGQHGSEATVEEDVLPAPPLKSEAPEVVAPVQEKRRVVLQRSASADLETKRFQDSPPIREGTVSMVQEKVHLPQQKAIVPAASSSLEVSRRELTTLTKVLTQAGATAPDLEDLDASWNSLGVDPSVVVWPPSLTLPKLVRLNLSHNSLANAHISLLVKGAPAVEELDLGFNEITSVSGLERLHSTKVLNLSANQIKDASALAGMHALTCLDLSENQISSISALRGISLNVKLQTLHLRDNPLAFHARYRAQIIHLIPFLDSLDNRPLPVSSVKKKPKQPSVEPKGRKVSSQIAKRQAAAAAALSAGSTAHASPKRKAGRPGEAPTLELRAELDKLARSRSTHEVSMDEDKMARVLEQMPADELRRYIVEMYKSERVGGKRLPARSPLLRKENIRTAGLHKDRGHSVKGKAQHHAHQRLSMPKKLPSNRSPTASRKSSQPRRHTGSGTHGLVKVSASLLSPTDAFRRKTVEGAKQAEQKAQHERQVYLNELKRSRQRKRAPKSRQHAAPEAATKVPAGHISEMDLEVVEIGTEELDVVVKETRFEDWNREALQQARAAEAALQSLLRLSEQTDMEASLPEFKEKLVDVGLWKRMSLPSIDLTPSDKRYKYVKEVIEKVELSKAAVRNFVNILETAGPTSNKVKHYKAYIAEYDPVSSALNLLTKDTNNAPSPAPQPKEEAITVQMRPEGSSAQPKALKAEQSAPSRIIEPAGQVEAKKPVKSSGDAEKEQNLAPVAMRSLLQQSRSRQSQGGGSGTTNSVKFRMPTAREEGVTLPDELVRQREERQFHYDNESVASSVWSIEGQASVKRLEIDVSLRSNNEQETIDNTGEATPFVPQIAPTLPERTPLLEAPPPSAGAATTVDVEADRSDKEVVKEERSGAERS